MFSSQWLSVLIKLEWGNIFNFQHMIFFLIQNMGIKDEFHQNSILSCIKELCQSSPTSSSAIDDTTLMDNETSPSHGDTTATALNNTGIQHTLVPHSFSVLEKCDKCNKYLRGLLHQGFLCQGNIFLDLSGSLLFGYFYFS